MRFWLTLVKIFIVRLRNSISQCSILEYFKFVENVNSPKNEKKQCDFKNTIKQIQHITIVFHMLLGPNTLEWGSIDGGGFNFDAFMPVRLGALIARTA